VQRTGGLTRGQVRGRFAEWCAVGEDGAEPRIHTLEASAMAELPPGERVRVVATGSPCCGRVGSAKRLSASGKLAALGLGGRSPTVRVTSLRRASERVRTAEGAVAELAEELARLVRLVSHGPEARAKCRDGAPEVRK
jgi:hypothetical protein